MNESLPLSDEMRRRLSTVYIAGGFLLAGFVLPWVRPGQETIGAGLALVGLLVIALPILWQTIHAFRSTGFAATQFYMDQYVVLAIGACLATGQYLTGGVVAIVLVLGQMLEERSVVGVEYAISRLREMSRVLAWKLTDGEESQVAAETLRPGDRIRIRPGGAIPADARVETGCALVNQSNITGESLPIAVQSGDRIFAGTTNLDGLLEATVLESGGDTVMARVQKILEEAKETEAPIIRMAEDYARYYTPLVLLITLCVFFFTKDINRAIAVLIVSIPCAFVLASPSALVTAIACASRFGLLIKGARHFEEGRRIDTVVFDKTGTLTEGSLHLEKVWLHTATDREQTLAWAAALEQHSQHPVARALCAETEFIPVATDLREMPGLGVEAQVDGRKIQVGRLSWLQEKGILLASTPEAAESFSLVGLAVDGVHTATFGLADRLRTSATEAIERLRCVGVERFVLLTGDRHSVAQSIAGQLGLTDFQAECLPEDKQKRIEQLKAEGCRVLVVGDGLNDAPALSAGHLSVAMGALGNDVAISTADIALMNNDLHRLADLLELCHRTVSTINQNLLCGFGFILLCITLSSMGFIPPIMAAFVHEFSAFFVIFNSARLLRFDGLEDIPDAPAVHPAPAFT